MVQIPGADHSGQYSLRKWYSFRGKGHGLFVVAIITGGGGMLLLGLSLFTLSKTKRLEDYQDRKMLLSAFLFTLYGIWYASRAFDMPHHDSYRTSVIGWALLPGVAIGLLVLYLSKRVQKNAVLSEPDRDKSKPSAV